MQKALWLILAVSITLVACATNPTPLPAPAATTALATTPVVAPATLAPRTAPPLPAATAAPTEVPGPTRLQKLSGATGTQLTALKGMSADTVRDLFVRNAEKLGMRVYKYAEWVPGTKQLPQLIAGRKATPTFQGATPPVMPKRGQNGEANPITAPQPDEIIRRLKATEAFVGSLIEGEPAGMFVHEYPGCPVSVAHPAVPLVPISVGQSGARLAYVYSGTDFELEDIEIEGGTVFCDRFYGADGSIRYEVGKASGNPPKDTDLYLRSVLFVQGLQRVPNWTMRATTDGALPALRYTVRHATQLGAMMYQALDVTRARSLAAAAKQYGALDPYEPLFGMGLDRADDFVLDGAIYRDCTGVPFPVTFTRYPYRSKVCLSAPAYLQLARQDRLAQEEQAIQLLLKYNAPDRAYTDPANPVNTATPRGIAARIEASGWNGWGVNAFGKDPAYASAVRTNAFLVLESTLGYQYGDAVSQAYADATAAVLVKTQWGQPPFAAGSGVTTEEGTVFRPAFAGSQLIAWQAAGGQQVPFILAPTGIVSDLVDTLGMPDETLGPVPSNAETAITYWQALRVYLKQKYGIAYP